MFIFIINVNEKNEKRVKIIPSEEIYKIEMFKNQVIIINNIGKKIENTTLIFKDEKDSISALRSFYTSLENNSSIVLIRCKKIITE